MFSEFRSEGKKNEISHLHNLEEAHYFPIRPRRIDNQNDWNIRAKEFEGTEAINYSVYHEKERFLPNLRVAIEIFCELTLNRMME